MDNVNFQSEREVQVQKMLLHIGNLIRYLLDSISYIYKQNNIDYSVDGFHQKIMRQLAPPYELLKLTDQNDGNYDYGLQNQKNNQQQNQDNNMGNTIVKQLNNIPFNNQIPQMNLIPKQNLPRVNLMNLFKNTGQAKQEKKRFFIGNNPTGVLRQIKQFQQSKGDLFKKSLKVMRHTKKFTQSYQENEARKNDPNRIPKRRPRLPKSQYEHEQTDLKQKFARIGRRGRKVQDWVLQQKIYEWVKQQALKGRKVRKVDIRNKFKSMSGGKFTGSTGWCRRFIQRHPEINSWFKKALGNNSSNQIALFDPIKTQPLNSTQNNGNNWIQPITSSIFDQQYQEQQQSQQQVSGDIVKREQQNQSEGIQQEYEQLQLQNKLNKYKY